MTTMDWGMLVLLAFVLGFWIGKAWEAHWWLDRIDPKRREWRE